MLRRLGSYITLYLLALPAHDACAQQAYNQLPEFLNANSYWAFGYRAGIDFSTGIPVADSTALYPNTSGGAGYASVASPVTGQLYFYTDGYTVYDRTHSPVPNGTGLLGNTMHSTAQGACIVPMPDSPGKYYLFSLSPYTSDNRGGVLYYSILDTSLNNGLGDVDANRKNIRLGDSLSSCMIAVPGARCDDIWLLLHDYPDPEFIAYHITPAGLDTVQVRSRTGVQLRGRMSGLGAYAISNMAVSPDRSMLAITSTAYNTGNFSRQSGALLCRFDAAAGIVSDAMLIADSFNHYGACFSPGNTRLYLTRQGVKEGGIFQYDVSVFDSALIRGSMTRVYSDTASFPVNSPAGFKLYRDTIYIACYWDYSVARINQPDLPGTACDIERYAVPLWPNTQCRYQLPNDVVYPLPQQAVNEKKLDTTLCAGFTPVTLRVTPGFTLYEWNDGAGDTVRQVTSPGTYWVRSGNLCYLRVDTFVVRETELSFSLGPDTVICTDTTSILLHIPVAGAAFRWQDGSTDSSFRVTHSGVYWVTAADAYCQASDTVHIVLTDIRQSLPPDTILCREDPFRMALNARVSPYGSVLWSTGDTIPSLYVSDTGIYWVTVQEATCTGTDTVHIASELCDCRFSMPTAFTPNGDGKNDLFRVRFEPGCPVRQYELYVYDRWGELVFSSFNYSDGWDGKIRGMDAELGTYMFMVSLRTGTSQKAYFRKGDVTLIR